MRSLLMLGIVLLFAAPANEVANLSIRLTSPTSVEFGWEASVDATQYVIQQGTQTKGPYENVIWTALTAETVSGLTPGTTYYWVVRAVDQSGFWSLPSNEVSLTIPSGPTIDDCAAFTGMYAVTVTPTSLLLQGSKGPGSIARFDFQVASPNSPVNRVAIAIDGAIIQPIMGCPTEGIDCGAVMTPLAGYNFVMPAASGRHTLMVTAWNRKGCSRTASGPGVVVP